MYVRNGEKRDICREKASISISTFYIYVLNVLSVT